MASLWPRPLALKSPLGPESSPCWLELKSGIPGQGCYLLEHRGANKTIDELTGLPRTIVAVGGKSKRQFLSGSNHEAIAFRRISPSTIVIDCELHNKRIISKMKATPPVESCRQHRVLLPHTCLPVKIRQFAWSLYWQALIPFTSIILLFVEDLGGFDAVADVLTVWARQSVTTPAQSPPRVILLHREPADIKWFEGQLRARLKASLLKTDPFDQTIDFQATLLYQAAFESIRLLPYSAKREVAIQTDQMFTIRTNAGYSFNSEHLKYLLQESVSQFCNGGAFNFHRATRLGNRIPADLEDHIVNFVTASRKADLDVVTLVASALDMEAHPPGMHCTSLPSLLNQHCSSANYSLRFPPRVYF